MEKLCIYCDKPGKFGVQKVISRGKEVEQQRNVCNKCRYKRKKEAENLKIELYG